MKKKEFCSVCYTALFFKKSIPHLSEAISNIRACVDVVHGATAAALMSFLIAYSSHAAAIKDGWKKVCYRGLLRTLVPRMGSQGAGQGESIVGVVGSVGELFAGVLEGLGQRNGNSLRR